MSSALNEYLQAVQAEVWPHEDGGHLSEYDLSAAFAYSLFGLPDGTVSPKGVTLAPGPGTLRDALLRVVGPMLKGREKNLLATPLEFARVPFIDAAHVFADVDKHWIVLNHTLFGSLYSVNDRFMEILEVESGLAKTEDPIALARRFPDLLSRFMFGERIVEDDWLVRLNTHLNPDMCWLIGAFTSVQQVFLVLHEFGHVSVSHDRANTKPFSAHLSVWRSISSRAESEKVADTFAAEHMRDGPWPDRVADNPQARVIGLFLLFESLEILRKMGKYSPASHASPRERFQHIVAIVDQASYDKIKNSLTSHQSLLDDVYTVWKIEKQ